MFGISLITFLYTVAGRPEGAADVPQSPIPLIIINNFIDFII